MGERTSPYPQGPLGTARPTAPVGLTAVVVVVAQKTEQTEDKRHELWRRHGVRAGGTRRGQRTAVQPISKAVARQVKPNNKGNHAYSSPATE